eukprot:4915494-Ditylum_brightwellii.AAC.1
MGYVLGQLFFSKYILDKIGQKALRAFTAKCGYNRNMTYVIQDCPIHLGGCKFTPLYHIQGSSQIQNFLCYYRMQSDTKKLPQVVVAWAQHQSGMSEPILWDTFPAFISGSNRTMATTILHRRISISMQT